VYRYERGVGRVSCNYRCALSVVLTLSLLARLDRCSAFALGTDVPGYFDCRRQISRQGKTAVRCVLSELAALLDLHRIWQAVLHNSESAMRHRATFLPSSASSRRNFCGIHARTAQQPCSAATSDSPIREKHLWSFHSLDFRVPVDTMVVMLSYVRSSTGTGPCTVHVEEAHRNQRQPAYHNERGQRQSI
jgi:hypothetical protein